MSEAATSEDDVGVSKDVLGPAVTVGGGVLWLILALRTPTNTFHFAPIIVAAAWPMVARGSVASTTRRAWSLAGAGTTFALAIGFFLWATDHLQGPALWHVGPALIEVVLFALLGGAIGVIAQLRHR